MDAKKDEWKRIIDGLTALGGVVAQVGWFDSDSATIALINDRGGSKGNNPPPRPVLGPGFDAAREELTHVQSRAVSRILRGGAGRQVAEAAAEEAGAVVEQAVRDAIDTVQPPNAATTVAQKHGYTAPLRGFSPDRIWTRLEHRVVSTFDAADSEEI